MSSQQIKSEGSAPDDVPPQTAADVENVVTPNLEIPSASSSNIVAVSLDDPEKRLGRPLGYNEEIVEWILDEIVSGQSLKSIGERDGFPSTKTIARWRQRFPEFDEKVRKAVHQSIEQLQDRALSYADRDFSVTTKDEIPVAVHNAGEAERQVGVILRVTSNRIVAARNMSSAKAGDDAKIIEGTCEVVETDTNRFIRAIDDDAALKKFLAVTGIKSKALDENATAPAKQ